jgi:hypothetical protein
LEEKIKSAVEKILSRTDEITDINDRARFERIVRELVKNNPNISMAELIKNAKK